MTGPCSLGSQSASPAITISPTVQSNTVHGLTNSLSPSSLSQITLSRFPCSFTGLVLMTAKLRRPPQASGYKVCLQQVVFRHLEGGDCSC